MACMGTKPMILMLSAPCSNQLSQSQGHLIVNARTLQYKLRNASNTCLAIRRKNFTAHLSSTFYTAQMNKIHLHLMNFLVVFHGLVFKREGKGKFYKITSLFEQDLLALFLVKRLSLSPIEVSRYSLEQ